MLFATFLVILRALPVDATLPGFTSLRVGQDATRQRDRALSRAAPVFLTALVKLLRVVGVSATLLGVPAVGSLGGGRARRCGM